ncbi:MAG: glycosyltransferase [Oligoflexia bacterium]|nr:glycosyltransferase [Oligoflexia bacterium]
MINTKKNVLIVIPNLGGGGAERQATYIANLLNKDKFNVYMFLFEKKGIFLQDLNTDILIESTPSYINYIFKNIPIIRQLINIPFLIRVILKFNINVIVSRIWMTSIISFLSLLLIRGKNKIAFFPTEDCFPEKDTSLTATKLSFLKKFLIKKAYNYSTHVISISNEMTKCLENFYNLSNNKILTIYNGVDLNKFQYSARAFRNFDKDKTYRLLSIGRFTYQKGFDILLYAVKKLREENYNVHLNIFGNGPLKEELVDLKNKIGLNDHECLINPFNDKIIDEYHRNDIFILSSRYEGLVLVLMEALACGIPIVSTDCKSSPSEILDFGRCGHLVIPESADSLAEGIKKVITNYDIGIKKAEQGRFFAEEKFDINRIVNRYEDLFCICDTRSRTRIRTDWRRISNASASVVEKPKTYI